MLQCTQTGKGSILLYLGGKETNDRQRKVGARNGRRASDNLIRTSDRKTTQITLNAQINLAYSHDLIRNSVQHRADSASATKDRTLNN